MKVFPICKKRYLNSVKNRSGPIKLFAKSWFQQFTPFSYKKTDAETCVITNGIPKSGTYLINKIVEALGKWENTNTHISPFHWDILSNNQGDVVNNCLARFAIKKLRNGQFVAAHLGWSIEFERIIRFNSKKRRIKHILIYRDPRDTHISCMKFETYSKIHLLSPGAKAIRKFMLENFSNDEDRLTHTIEKRKNFNFLQYRAWLNNPNCHAVKFEDLYLDVQKLEKGVLGDTLRNLFKYLEVDLSNIELAGFHNNVFGRGRTFSKEKDKIGQYKRLFKKQHYNILDNPAFRKTLNAFGYKW